jgi:hypothetical protein
LDISPDSRLLAIGGDSSIVYDLASGVEPFKLPDPAAVPDQLASRTIRFSPNGLVVAPGTGTLIVASATDGHIVRQLPAVAAGTAAAFSADGRLLGTSEAQLWRLSDGLLLWSSLQDPVASSDDFREGHAEFSPDGSLLLVSVCARELSAYGPPACTAHTRLLRVTDGSPVADFGTTLSRDPTFLPDGTRVLAGSQVVDIASRAVIALPLETTVSIALADGRIVVGQPDGVTRILCPVR